MKHSEFVLDCSVTMAWFFENEASASTDALLDALNDHSSAIVASHWALEVCNTLMIGERRKRASVSQSTHFLDILGSLSIQVDGETASKAAVSTIALARTHSLTAYDAAYLELAMRRGLPLATLDKNLRIAAQKTGVPCLPDQ